MKKVRAVGLLGGSFNPAHEGHRRLSLAALGRLRLDEVWWLVSPQNPLKPETGMAPLAARLASARKVARHPRIRVTDWEARQGTRYTVDTVAALLARFPHLRFVWLMGADNLLELHRWTRWRTLLRRLPVVVAPRPGYMRWATAPAVRWVGGIRRSSPARWRCCPLPAVFLLNLRPDSRSATAIRARDPRWAEAEIHRPQGPVG
ncbi:MAG: nicotinate-nucleotide adenylyltransferase [Sphingomonadaceae bacterium]|uniref:nicotinate-nucleotide adenylyltransferase n=1 Tax=Thermaurantiacus sp. TaxID=2820283 RepID=UPI00298F1B9E|nr:nicotinate-nucleotide adenylyltransferase [Thermaurantiacus sp.]MCS6987055.1 nicotinate-nucleotide adenylyltransferase [Sphingomonadaceae bacterium]MDW8415607.1 nicotinate-nucleotide adenylyltransferase [Thermaurantiacus sp.]